MNLIEEIRVVARQYPHEEPNPRAWWRAGYIEEALKGAAAAVPVEANPPTARIELARQLTGNQELTSYKELTEDYVQAIYEVTTSKGLLVKAWLKETYGQQLELL